MVRKSCAGFIIFLVGALGLAADQARGESVFAHRGFARAHHEFAKANRGSDQENVNFTSTLDFPWDWAHRYPPNFLAGPSALFFPPVAVQIARPNSSNTNFTYTFDVPWDWAHRYPPSFYASASESFPPPVVTRVPGCRAQDETIGSSEGKQQTVTMIRC